MREKTKKIVDKTVQIISSKYFFWGVIALFVFQAVWIAFSFRYPMIYDEYYHFGLIEHFSHQWLPWINNQPVTLDLYGALGRHPYLLYHYLMSFPFRIIALFTNDLAVQVISMRLINIGLFAGGLVVFARLFKVMKVQPVFRNVALLFFVLLPVTPFVAATVNYDNAVFLLTALLVLIGVRIIQSQNIQWHNYALIILIGMIGSLVKSSFLPIFAAGFIFIFVRLIINHKKRLVHDIVESFRTSGLWLKIVILVPIAIVGFLFAERFAVNIIQYHSLDPSCTSQMSQGRCNTNPVELRNRYLEKIKSKDTIPAQVPQYANTWFSEMINTLLISGSNTNGKFGTEYAKPLPIIYLVVFWGTIVSFAAFFYSLDKLRKIPGFWLTISIIVLYLASLFYVDLSHYYEYYQPIAIQGRYLLPLLPFMILFALLGLNNALRRFSLAKLAILLIVFVLYLNGAGAITHIMRSNDNWYWDNSQIIYKINNKAKNILRPFLTEWWYEK
jgi:Predicted membrane protein (DUF2142).